MPRLAITDDEITNCFDAIVELRPHLSRDSFLTTVRTMEDDGFKLAFIEESNQVVAVAGYRIYSNLFMGKHCEVEDLVTVEQHRSKGYGEQMIKWLREQAIAQGCNVLHLDSGTHRGKAHKFYFAQNFTIASYHFSEEIQ